MRLLTSVDVSGKIARRRLPLLRYTIYVVQQPGVGQQALNALSRLKEETTGEANRDEELPVLMNYKREEKLYLESYYFGKNKQYKDLVRNYTNCDGKKVQTQKSKQRLKIQASYLIWN